MSGTLDSTFAFKNTYSTRFNASQSDSDQLDDDAKSKTSDVARITACDPNNTPDDDDDDDDESSTDLMKASRDHDTAANARGSSFLSQITSRCGSFLNAILWEREHPEAFECDTQDNIDYMRISSESLGGFNSTDTIKLNKIIKHVIKEVYVK